MVLCIFFFALLLFSCTCEDKPLRFAFTFVSQGTMSPAYIPSGTSWESWDEKGPDQLTAMGMREQFLLGHELRNRYLNEPEQFINYNYVLDQIYIRSIDHSYAETGVQSFLRGFLGDNNRTLNTKELEVAIPPMAVEKYFIDMIGNKVLPLGIDTLPYHTYNPSREDVFAPRYCVKAKEKNAEAFKQSNEVKKLRDKYEATYLDIQKKYNYPNLQFPNYVKVLESIATGIRLQKEERLNDIEKTVITKYMDSLYFYSKSIDHTANCYRLSGALKLMLNMTADSIKGIMKDYKNPATKKAIFIFSKDTMLTSLLEVHGKSLNKVMSSTSIFIFEFRGPANFTFEQLTVNIKFNDDLITSLSYSEFVKKIGDIIQSDYETFCAHNS